MCEYPDMHLLAREHVPRMLLGICIPEWHHGLQIECDKMKGGPSCLLMTHLMKIANL